MLLTLKLLLSSLVDYAGLFPPAQLSLSEAIATYARIQSSPYRWLVGRFVLPVTGLPEFVSQVSTVAPDSGAQWPLSVVLSKNWEADLAQVRQYVATGQMIRAVEVPPLPLNAIQNTAIQTLCFDLPVGVTAFFEIPWNADLDAYLTALRRSGAAAKLRTGGMTRDAFPDSATLAQRIVSLANANIPFKVTAGLHHPLRGDRRLTDNPDSDSATMHGFLNVALLAAFAAQQRISLDDAIALLEERSIHAFQLTETAIRWRNYALSHADLERSRQQFFHSFGSCSLQEPIDDLHTLRLL
jgi:hypothetical protein